MKSPLKKLGVHRNSNSQGGSPFVSVGVHSLTLSYTFGSMTYDSQASILTRTFANLCLGCKPKDKVASPRLRLRQCDKVDLTSNVIVLGV
jgi:hypothetical protein